ncbi:MAG: hypothetical protein OEN01_11850, partial [Candidatus Krumholzibacteria bacterium]|nr:hypothetical protein [Candidatus Krumholzibacteria bacterium]
AFYELAAPFLPAWLAKEYGDDERREIADILQDAIETLADLGDRCAVFAVPVAVDAEARAVLADAGARAVLAAFTKVMEAHAGPFTPEAFKALAKVAGAETKRKGKDLFFPLRAAITGCLHGPDLSRVAAAKGRARVLRALAEA